MKELQERYSIHVVPLRSPTSTIARQMHTRRHARGTRLVRRTSIHQQTTAFGNPNRRATVVANRTGVAARLQEQCRHLFYKQTGQHEAVFGHEEILVAAHHVESAKKRQKGFSARQEI